MTRNEIKEFMLTNINDHLATEIEELKIEELITKDIILDFLWEKDFGATIIRNYIDDHEDELINEYLEEIFDEISEDDLELPW